MFWQSQTFSKCQGLETCSTGSTEVVDWLWCVTAGKAHTIKNTNVDSKMIIVTKALFWSFRANNLQVSVPPWNETSYIWSVRTWHQHKYGSLIINRWLVITTLKHNLCFTWVFPNFCIVSIVQLWQILSLKSMWNKLLKKKLFFRWKPSLVFMMTQNIIAIILSAV